MTALILAAGLGSRMRPLTNHTPKPLLEIADKPLIVWHIERLRDLGFINIVINVAYLGQQIIDYLGDGSQYGVKITFSDEQNEGALETAGGIVKALPLLSDTFLVVNGDIWTDYIFDNAFELAPNSLAHLVLVDNPTHNPNGDFFVDNSEEKYTFSGIGYYSTEMFKHLLYGKQALAPLLFTARDMNQLTTQYHNGKWYDIGTPERLMELNSLISS